MAPSPGERGGDKSASPVFGRLSHNELIKLDSSKSLMLPPQIPKKLKRPQNILKEDDYNDALAAIIERDFFPSLKELNAQNEYLEALESRDPQIISRLKAKLSKASTPISYQKVDSWLNSETIGASKLNAENKVENDGVELGYDTNMSLDAFQAKYTSEDNNSFNELLDSINARNKSSKAWVWNDNMNQSEKIVEESKRIEAAQDSQSDELQAWRGLKQTGINRWNFKPINSVMYYPEAIEDLQPQPIPKRGIRYKNTSFNNDKQGDVLTSISSMPSPAPSLLEKAISGTLNEPTVRGYAFVDPDPDPEKELVVNNPRLAPFRISEPSKRDEVAIKLGDKASMTIRARSGSMNDRLNRLQSFVSSPDARKSVMSPAGRRLLARTNRGSRSALESPITVRATPSANWTPVIKKKAKTKQSTIE